MAALDISLQPDGELIEQQANSQRRFQIFMHGEPDLQRELDRFRKDRRKLRRSRRKIYVASADSDACSQRRELGEIAVATKAERLVRDLPRKRSERAKGAIVSVEADQPMAPEFVQ